MALYKGYQLISGNDGGQDHILCNKRQYNNWLSTGQIQDKKILSIILKNHITI